MTTWVCSGAEAKPSCLSANRVSAWLNCSDDKWVVFHSRHWTWKANRSGSAFRWFYPRLRQWRKAHWQRRAIPWRFDAKTSWLWLWWSKMKRTVMTCLSHSANWVSQVGHLLIATRQMLSWLNLYLFNFVMLLFFSSHWRYLRFHLLCQRHWSEWRLGPGVSRHWLSTPGSAKRPLGHVWSEQGLWGMGTRYISCLHDTSLVSYVFQLCDTYPRSIYVPASAPSKVLIASSKFRSKNRLPALSYLHPDTQVICIMIECVAQLSIGDWIIFRLGDHHTVQSATGWFFRSVHGGWGDVPAHPANQPEV